jgi:hypothetical protein
MPEELSAYEKQRLKNIQANDAQLKALGLTGDILGTRKKKENKRKTATIAEPLPLRVQPKRHSTRSKGPGAYAEGLTADLIAWEEKGRRLPSSGVVLSQTRPVRVSRPPKRAAVQTSRAHVGKKQRMWCSGCHALVSVNRDGTLHTHAPCSYVNVSLPQI